MKDYFLDALIEIDDDLDNMNIRPDIASLINDDIRSYRRHMIKQYNSNTERATDAFCFKKFLNDYSVAINVFGLHGEYNCRRSFNGFIDGCWQYINNEDIFDENSD